MATIKDVAKLAGVSVSTISRVLNRSGYFSKETEEVVRNAMEKLDYKPNQLARGLVSKRTHTIGLVIPDVTNPYFADIARGTEDAAMESGYSVILCNTDWRLDREEMYFHLLKGKWVEGVIIVGSRTSEELLSRQLEPLPNVFVDRKLSLGNYLWVDHKLGGKLATDVLIQQGCRDIVHIAGPADSVSAVERKRGFEWSIRESAHVRGVVVESDFRFAGGYEAAKHIFAGVGKVDGIFAANDLMAIGVVQAAKECGVDIPNDVQLIGYDDIEAAKYVSPAISTVRQPAYEMGQAAFHLLQNSLKNGLQQNNNLEFEVQVVRRNSTRAI